MFCHSNNIWNNLHKYIHKAINMEKLLWENNLKVLNSPAMQQVVQAWAQKLVCYQQILWYIFFLGIKNKSQEEKKMWFDQVHVV